MSLVSGGVILGPKMEAVIVCDELDLEYETYLAQPKWWLELRMMKRRKDNEMRKKSNRSQA